MLPPFYDGNHSRNLRIKSRGQIQLVVIGLMVPFLATGPLGSICGRFHVGLSDQMLYPTEAADELGAEMTRKATGRTRKYDHKDVSFSLLFIYVFIYSKKTFLLLLFSVVAKTAACHSSVIMLNN